MKKLLIAFILTITIQQLSFAQFKFGIKAGLSSTDIETNDLLIDNSDTDDFSVALKEINYGLNFGLFLQAKVGGLFIQPEIIFNSSSVDYKVDDLDGGQLFNVVKRESYKYVDIPIIVGCKLGPLRLGAGPVGHFFINSTSELFDVDGYDQKFDSMTLGWQAGVGLDIWKFLFDLRYEGNFSKYGDHMVFFGEQYNFDNSPARVVASIGFAF